MISFSKKTQIVGVVSDENTWMGLNQKNVPCDIVELRIDALPETKRNLPLIKPCPKPLLLTFRHSNEGGFCKWDEAMRQTTVENLFSSANAIDWELALFDKAKPLLQKAKINGLSIIASAHYFHHTPALQEMQNLAVKAYQAGADLIKIAFTPLNKADIQTGLTFLEKCPMPAAVMGMGAFSAESRILYTQNGSALLYGYLGGTPTAPNQLSARECQTIREKTAF